MKGRDGGDRAEGNSSQGLATASGPSHGPKDSSATVAIRACISSFSAPALLSTQRSRLSHLHAASSCHDELPHGIYCKVYEDFFFRISFTHHIRSDHNFLSTLLLPGQATLELPVDRKSVGSPSHANRYRSSKASSFSATRIEPLA